VVLVILIALWAVVLLPPYIKDRRSSGRTFRPSVSGGAPSSSAQRFLPLQNIPTSYSTAAVSSPTGTGASGVTSLGAGSNVVPLRPVGSDPVPLSTAAAAYLDQAPSGDETLLQQAWDTPDSAGFGVPASAAAARERRRHVLPSTVAETGLLRTS